MTYHNRHECKFVVPEPIAARAMRLVLPFVEPDGFAATRPDHTYSIASLYLDDERGSLYHETIEGQAQRFKLRVRSYTDEPTAPVFLEVKRRRDRIVQKVRCPVPRDALPALLRGEAVELDDLSPQKRAASQQFLRLQQLTGATPRLTVRYERQAYQGIGDPDVRVTFDRKLAVLPESQAMVRLQAPRYSSVPARGVILELKFTDRCPSWLAETVRILELRRRSFSKYCTCADAVPLSHREQVL